ncbi:hypothetical protein A3A46_00320 [Candidatus Roizmanbacteria bacterium RIFCSPLOWO2_01_FULL_37_13]|uniref:Uncharacterized protein n=1 Tax=Candidatus Roizmanbacteria bacterium RIFCSPHIGHO2_02_FULL_38_11 TaxID=1802039 RepID=A0A1F7H581_9BACT|nr:MAG: hypothetical protein A3C25_02955 [Candidatus Roizmanbacteria bacterium RIFCSPHIGHO2_02_FULL_38_11]OGK34427.1 MAG: hypothetical protein A3F58_01835 [Candidatus Roizmanbacteria bacterium RIFCSPHIGHO2_12_FULL_37_9b]OGK42339.1 MAG: hypothetical protein A3A46_00320 [Candidatus Roizmanbacteria bacterium RIFCSPLOWO2_01_FULL_37_13]
MFEAKVIRLPGKVSPYDPTEIEKLLKQAEKREMVYYDHTTAALLYQEVARRRTVLKARSQIK